MEIRYNINTAFMLSNKSIKSIETIQILHGPSRIRTNDPRHVKAVS